MAVGLSGCGSAKPNVTTHMVPGSVRLECLQFAKYNILSGHRLIQSKVDATHHGLEVYLAVMKEAADQLPVGNEVRNAALAYVSRGTMYPYFQPCRRLMTRAETGLIPRSVVNGAG